jgi:rfaE bifunctional protein nucleotidyltransferase chain/domain
MIAGTPGDGRVMGKNKIFESLDELAARLAQLRGEQRRIVLCHGVFDLLHIGHIRHFQQARQFGDVLVVSLTPDRYVNKGANRPAFTERLRAEVVASLDCVDYVAINLWPSAVETIHTLRPHVFVKGSEFRNLNDTIGHVAREKDAIAAVGGCIMFTEDITFSSSALINQYMSQFPEHVREYLGELGKRFTPQQIREYLEAAAAKRVLVIGETIIDEYTYCDVIGKSGKEPVLAARYLTADRFGGGVLACANHVAGFCDHVDVLTFLGEESSQEAFVRNALKANVDATLLKKKGSPTIVKKRFVEQYLAQKLFEVYEINDEPLRDEEDAEFCALLERMVPEYDLVVVADYGHGMLSPRAIKVLCAKAKFVAVNTQSNAGNHGFNMISKYSRADYVCLAQREFALETRNQRLSPQEMVRHVAHKLSCPRIMMTQGKYGSLFFTAPDGFHQCPAFATQMVDRVGAGDAVLSVTSLCALAGAPAEVITFVGNVVGAEACTILGNKRSIERVPLYRHIECLLKIHRSESKVAVDSLPFAKTA